MSWVPSSGRASPPVGLLGVSLKTYLGFQQTRSWLTGVSELAPLLVETGLFVLPAFPCLPDAQRLLAGTGIAYGAQDGWPESAPCTGEVSMSMLAELGCRYVAVGHAERRRLFAEDDAFVARKAGAAVQHGLIPVVCVGEDHACGVAQAVDAVLRQLSASLRGVPDGPLVIAYEPVWAIGAPTPATPEHVLPVAAAIREALVARGAASRVIYGGSAGPGTLTALHASGDPPSGQPGPIDGLFLGRHAHDLGNLRDVLTEMHRLRGPSPATPPLEATG